MDELLELALNDPARADSRARELMDDPSPLVRSYAYQALGIVMRDGGRTADATAFLRRGVRAARACGVLDRERDVRGTLAATLAVAGKPAQALREFDCAMDGAVGEVAARIAIRRAAVLAILERHVEAIDAMRSALELIEPTRNVLWEARTRVWLGHLELRRGRLADAEHETRLALSLLKDDVGSADRFAAVGNLAEIAVSRGNIAQGLRLWADALDGCRRTGHVRFEEVGNLASAYLAAGMPESAIAVIADYEGALPEAAAAQAMLVRARARCAVGDWASAADDAVTAGALFKSQGRVWFGTRSRLVALQARCALGDGPRHAREAKNLAAEFAIARADEAPVALTLAGRLASGGERGELWGRAATYRNHPNALVRASAWLARALEREEAGDRGGVLRACRAGLDAIDEQRRLLGSSELRAQATTHGRELTEVALRAAATDPRRLLGWAERTRATTLAQPRMTSDAATIPESLAALRDNGRQLAEARAAGEPTERLERERLRLERAVRAESHTVSAVGADADRPATAEEVVAGVGDGCLVELVDVDGTLHVLVVHGGKVRRRIAGPTADALALLDPVAMLLRRSARGRPAATEQIGRRLEDAILGDSARLIPDGPVVLAPTIRLHGLPWAVLPALADRPFSVVPSAGQWLRARAVRRPADRRTVLVCGPGLESGGAEVPLLAAQHPAATLLTDKQATLEPVLAGIDGADLVHLAAHGHFRADSPLFSSLDLADGPLTVHDIERIGRAPYRVVLSACESGVLAPVGAQELLGLAAALFGLGTAGLVCSVAEVNDAATADLMVRLHAGLAAGNDPATALHEVRRETTDPIAAATASAFLALGV